MGQKQTLIPKTIAFGGEDNLEPLSKDIKYNDDDDISNLIIQGNISEDRKGLQIISQSNDINIDENINEFYNIQNLVTINSKLDCKTINPNINNKTNYNLLATLNCAEIKSSTKTSIDLICVIDRSWSMKGEKLDFIKQSFKFLLEYLDERDRLSVIVFDNEIKRLCPLWSMNKENKVKVEGLINSVIAKGGTNIAKAMQHAFEIIKQRKQENNVTSIFLLSDGIDLNADRKVRNLLNKEQFFLNQTSGNIKNESSNKYGNFSIHTFGYGNDHDAKMMQNISQIADGCFYFVNDLSTIDECFLGCLAGLLSVIAQDVEIRIRPSNYIEITKFYGVQDLFNFDKDSNTYSMKILQLISGRKFNFLFEVKINNTLILKDNLKNVEICDIICNLQGLKSSNYQKTMIEFQCIVPIADDSDNIKREENTNGDVVFNFYRLKCGEFIRNANELSLVGNYTQAKALLEPLIEEMKKKLQYIDNEDLKNLIMDLDKVLINLDPDIFVKSGKHELIQNFDCLIREKHNIGSNLRFANTGQERFVSQHRARKLGLFSSSSI
jgi:hypothetical protein